MQKRLIILIIGVVLALLSVFMVKIYLDQQRRMLREQSRKELANIQANQSAVLVAKQDIPQGTSIESGMLETAIIPNRYIQPQAVTSLDRISGMLVIAHISKGEQISLSKLSHPATPRAGGLAQLTPVGKRAVTVSVDSTASLWGMVRPGDYVDVSVLLPVPVRTPEGKQENQVAVVPLFQNVLLLTVGPDLGFPSPARPESRYKPEEAKGVPVFVTLALSPQEANLIAFVQEQGKVRLILRSPSDSNIEPIQAASWDTLFQYLAPLQEVPESPEPKKEEEQRYIEIYRGLNKEKIPLNK